MGPCRLPPRGGFGLDFSPYESLFVIAAVRKELIDTGLVRRTQGACRQLEEVSGGFRAGNFLLFANQLLSWRQGEYCKVKCVPPESWMPVESTIPGGGGETGGMTASFMEITAPVSGGNCFVLVGRYWHLHMEDKSCVYS